MSFFDKVRDLFQDTRNNATFEPESSMFRNIPAVKRDSSANKENDKQNLKKEMIGAELPPGGHKQAGNDAVFSAYDEYGNPTHISAKTQMSDDHEPKDWPSASSGKVKDEVDKKIDEAFVKELFGNPDAITSPTILLEKLEKIKNFSFGQRQALGNASQTAELTGEKIYGEFSTLANILKSDDISAKMKLKSEIGILSLLDKDDQIKAIDTYLKRKGFTSQFGIRLIATRLLTDRLTVPSA